jgi:serine/threonine protein kinase/formylglycine-generating enzyme required for sulfatase activity
MRGSTVRLGSASTVREGRRAARFPYPHPLRLPAGRVKLPMIGTSVSHYRIVSHIGAGGMGTVYLAEDTNLKRRVALKFLSPGTIDDPNAAARLLREARAASALDHPHIATVYEIGDHAGQPFIAMAHYEGETLAARLAHGQMPIGAIARIVAQLADALDAAHTAGIVHRDLKPSNLLLTTTGHLKVLDFGLARTETGETATQLTAAGSAVGTAAYMSPEQAAGDTVDARSDLWSLGVVTYEMLAGRRPFDGTSALAIIHAVLTATPPAIRTLRPDVAPELEAIADRTLVRDRDQRTITAAGIRDLAATCHARLSSGPFAAVASPRVPRRRWVVATVLACAVAGGGFTWRIERNAKFRWAQHEALPEIIKLAGADRFDDAYRLAQRAQPYIADDPLLAEQLRAISRRAVVVTRPSGAEVFYRPYGRRSEPWRRLGTSPIDMRVPRGVLHFKATMAGRQMAEDVGPGQFAREANMHLTLVAASQAPPGMVRITSSNEKSGLRIAGLEHVPDVHLPDYWIDRHEVTNRAFKQFVDDNGYRRPELWREPFLNDGRELAFAAAMAHFRDATGRPGPATWEMGGYIAGTDDYPVAGVSWYEAAAYARWAGKSLPTLYHWSRAADPYLSADVVPVSNLNGKSLLRAGAAAGITRGGTTDMAGNVREWCLTAAGTGRYIAGGAWNEPAYTFNGPEAQSPFARHATDGFRCIKVDRADDLSAELTARIDLPSRDLRKARPVSQVVVETWRRLLYTFDHGDLHAKIEAVNDTSREWRIEKVSYAAAYGEERIPAYLFLPKNAKPPYQVMVSWGSAGLYERSSVTTNDFDRYTFIVRSGRAFLYPIYKSMFERADGLKDDIPDTTTAWRDHVIMWSKDVARSVDYLQSRSDIAKGKIGHIALSADRTPLILAVEPRLSLGVIYCGGFARQESLPEVDPVNFAPLVTVPVLMLNGRYDYFYPTATSQEPHFTLLGTAAAHKRRVVYESSHMIPRNETIKEVVNWMEKYWGEPSR